MSININETLEKIVKLTPSKKDDIIFDLPDKDKWSSKISELSKATNTF